MSRCYPTWPKIEPAASQKSIHTGSFHFISPLSDPYTQSYWTLQCWRKLFTCPRQGRRSAPPTRYKKRRSPFYKPWWCYERGHERFVTANKVSHRGLVWVTSIVDCEAKLLLLLLCARPMPSSLRPPYHPGALALASRIKCNVPALKSR